MTFDELAVIVTSVKTCGGAVIMACHCHWCENGGAVIMACHCHWCENNKYTLISLNNDYKHVKCD